MSTRVARSKAHSRRVQGAVAAGIPAAAVVGHWDASHATTTSSLVTDRVGTTDLAVVSFLGLTTQNGLTCVQLSGASSIERLHKASGNPLAGRNHQSQPFAIQIVAKDVGTAGYVYADLRVSSAGNGPHCYQFGTVTINENNSIADGATDTAAPHVWYFEWAGAVSKIYKDGIVQVTGNLTGTDLVGSAITFGNVLNGGINGDVGRRFMEAKAIVGIQAPAAVFAEATALRAKWGF